MKKRQLKVSTGYNKILQNEKKVIDYLKGSSGEAYPKEIASYTGLKHSTVRSVCIRMVSKGLLSKHTKSKGMYCLVENDGHGVFSYNFHNLEIFYKSEIPLVERQLKVENSLNSLFRYRFIIGAKSKKASMRLSTKYPFNISSLGLAVEIFKKTIKEHLGLEISDKEIWISCIEFNKDYLNLRLEGINCITWDSLVAQFKLYQKKKGVREEFKKKIKFNFDLLESMLRKGISTVEEMALLQRQDEKINLIFKNQNKMNNKLEMIFRILQKDNKTKIDSGAYL